MFKPLKKTRLFVRDRRGATAIENALLMGAVGVAGLVAFNYLADDMKAAFTGAAAKIETAGEKGDGPSSETTGSRKGSRSGD